MTPAPHLLLIDAGNTRVKWAAASPHGQLRVAGDIATGEATSAWASSLAQKHPKHNLIFSSVVPKLVPAIRRAFLNRVHVVTGDMPALGLDFDYPNPAEMGADRIAAAVAAHETGRWPVIVAQCGTATAFTVLDAKGRLCGGAIAPGLHTQMAALLGATAQLPTTKLHLPKNVLAKSTQEAISAGVMLNFQGGVREIIQQLSAALPGRKKPAVILTGGHAHHLTHSLNLPHTFRPLLVFEGLRIIGSRISSQNLC